MNRTAAALASARSWTRLADALEAEAAPFANLGEGQEFLEVLMHGLPMLNVAGARLAADAATARAFA